jgi:hypothetical protein
LREGLSQEGVYEIPGSREKPACPPDRNESQIYLFPFRNREDLRLPYSDPHPFQVEMKATQMGLTFKAGFRSIHGAITGRYPRRILYLFPSKSDLTDSSKARIAPLIEGLYFIHQYAIKIGARRGPTKEEENDVEDAGVRTG